MKNMCRILVIVLVMSEARGEDGFMRVDGEHLMLNGSPFYGNGFNAYWLMYVASDPSQRSKISSAFEQATNHSLLIARTWAFRDAGDSPLQSSPGSYNQNMFQGLDYVISEAGKHNIKLILSLVDNYNYTGGKQQYVKWARNEGQNISSDDDFFTNSLVKAYYKNHIKAVLTRENTISGIAYKDDPTIMAWELMNEPRCPTDPSGNTIQAWIEEMASYVKSIDKKHLLEVGLEGFYGHKHHKKNPHFQVGTDFLRNNQIAEIDFATVHSYPDQWLTGESDEEQLLFLDEWLSSHIKDAETKIQKPVLFAEFGKSSKDPGYRTSVRDEVMGAVYAAIYSSARRGGAAAGGLFWQLLSEGTESLGDGYGIVLSRSPSSTATLIQDQSNKLNQVRLMYKDHHFTNG
ncbi:mannan endo-1,4-beta-mannosidase 7-like [Salvia miltiorrhiza]|uniref:mannan endo-1,4-beta-mannosidase 7-like n=1 Tax=Salvia miltiorrhiza TaxID=226208 RepID=UPI0025AD01E4|nr:mannan endo-1,4-beta-mannosidase 7-like [Salvia miltiorrhiza]